MFRKIVFPLALIMAAPASYAQDAQAEAILTEAQGYLHLTCNTLVAEFDDDEDKMLDVIGLMLAVSLNNRGIDFLQMNLTDQEVNEIQNEFADQIGDACADDADRLMAGIVDEVTAELVQFY